MQTPVYSSQPTGPRRVAQSAATSMIHGHVNEMIYGHVIVSGARVIRQASVHAAIFCSPAPPFLPVHHPPLALYRASLHLTLTLDPHILTSFTLTLHPHHPLETGKSIQYRVRESYCHLFVRRLSTSDQ